MKPVRTYTMRFVKDVRLVVDGKTTGRVKSLTVRVRGEDPYRAPELDIASVEFDVEGDSENYGIAGQVDPPARGWP